MIRMTVATTVSHLLLEGPATLTHAAVALKVCSTSDFSKFLISRSFIPIFWDMTTRPELRLAVSWIPMTFLIYDFVLFMHRRPENHRGIIESVTIKVKQ